MYIGAWIVCDCVLCLIYWLGCTLCIQYTCVDMYCMKILCIVVSPERTGGATVKELSSPDGE